MLGDGARVDKRIDAGECDTIMTFHAPESVGGAGEEGHGDREAREGLHGDEDVVGLSRAESVEVEGGRAVRLCCAPSVWRSSRRSMRIRGRIRAFASFTGLGGAMGK